MNRRERTPIVQFQARNATRSLERRPVSVSSFLVIKFNDFLTDRLKWVKLLPLTFNIEIQGPMTVRENSKKRSEKRSTVKSGSGTAIVKRRELCLVTGNSNRELALKISEYMDAPLADVEVSRFADGESRVMINQSMRGLDVFVVQSVCPPVNENLMDLLIMLDALRRASVRSICAVIPYYGYARQDKKVQPREPITAKLIANLLATAGAQRIMAMDLHAASIQGFFDLPVDHLTAVPTIVQHCKKRKLGGPDTVVVSPDVGGVVRARLIAERLNSGLAIIAKRRRRPNEAEIKEIIGSVEGYRCIMVDDMADTAGTLTLGADALLEQGAAEVIAICTHGLLSGEAVAKIERCGLKEFVMTDTIPMHPDKKSEKIKIISVAHVFAETIQRGFNDRSISELFA